MLIKIKNLNKTYLSETNTITRALEDVSLNFKDKGLNFIIGASGSGKSTLLNILGGIDSFDSGSVVVANHSLKDMNFSKLDEYRNSIIGFVFQELNLLEEYSVRENIKIALDINDATTEREIDVILEKLNIKEIKDNNVKNISSGQKQRVAIARALVKGANILLADEPTGSLDSKTSKEIINILKDISKDKLVIVITHDIEIAKKYGDRIIELKDGKVIKDVEKGSNKDNNIEVLSNNLIKVKKVNNKVISKINEIKKEYNQKVYVSSDTNIRKTKVLFKNATFSESTVEKGFKVVDVNNENMNNIELKSSKLKFRRLVDFVINNLFTKKKILICTILLMIISLLSFGISEGLSNYNKIESYTKTIEKENLKAINFIEINDTNKYQRIREEVISELDSKYTSINIAKEYMLPLKINLNKTFNGTKKYVLTGVSEVNDVTKYGYKVVEGKSDLSNYNEIVISEYFANVLISGQYHNGVNNLISLINKDIKLNDNEYTIVGIIESNYLTNNKNDKTILNNYLDIRDNLIYVKEGFLNNYFENQKYIEHSLDIYLKDESSSYNKEDLSIANVIFEDYISNSSLNYTFFNENKESLLENEILVSQSYIENNNLCEEECNENSFNNNELVLTYNSNIIYAYNNYKVVGTYEYVSSSNEIDQNLYNNSIIVSSGLKENISKNIYYNYQILVGLSSDNKLNEQFIKEAYSNGLQINKNFTSSYEKYSELMTEFSDVLNVLSMFLLVVSIGLLYGFIQSSISMSKRKIGILKSLGIKDSNIFYIFLIEVLFVALFTIIGSSALLLIASPIINALVRSKYGFYFSALNLNVTIFIQFIVITIIIAIVALIVPFIKFRKMSTTKLIGSR